MGAGRSGEHEIARCPPGQLHGEIIAQEAGTGTDRDWCDLGVPTIILPFTSTTASTISSRPRIRSTLRTRSAVASDHRMPQYTSVSTSD